MIISTESKLWLKLHSYFTDYFWRNLKNFQGGRFKLEMIRRGFIFYPGLNSAGRSVPWNTVEIPDDPEITRLILTL